MSSIEHGTLKVKRSKVMQGSSTKRWNISRKCHSVVEIHLSYRKLRSLERMAGVRFLTGSS